MEMHVNRQMLHTLGFFFFGEYNLNRESIGGVSLCRIIMQYRNKINVTHTIYMSSPIFQFD